MKAPYTIDIETYPNPDMVDFVKEAVEEPAAPKNYKDPEKIRIYVENALAVAKDEAVSKMALDPMTGKIGCFAVVQEGKELACVADKDEAVLLSALYSFLKMNDNGAPHICTWNGLSFDLPFIYKRMAMVCDFKPNLPLAHFSKRYTTEPHCDLRMVWTGWDSRGRGKLGDVATALIGEGKHDFDVAMVGEMLETEGGTKTLKEYCVQDAKITDRLYYKLKGVLF